MYSSCKLADGNDQCGCLPGCAGLITVISRKRWWTKTECKMGRIASYPLSNCCLSLCARFEKTRRKYDPAPIISCFWHAGTSLSVNCGHPSGLRSWLVKDGIAQVCRGLCLRTEAQCFTLSGMLCRKC